MLIFWLRRSFHVFRKSGGLGAAREIFEKVAILAGLGSIPGLKTKRLWVALNAVFANGDSRREMQIICETSLLDVNHFESC
jgi:hypothetical protein